MALIDDINALPTTLGDGQTGHLSNHQTIHEGLKNHAARIAGVESGKVNSADLDSAVTDLSSQISGKTDKSYVDSEVDDARWLHPIRLAGAATTIDTLTNGDDQGMYVCASTVTGLPITQGGWVTVYHERVTGRTTQIYISSHENHPGQWVRKTDHTGSEWRAWEHFNPRQIAQEVADARWLHPIRLATSDTIDTLTNEDDQHVYVCASTVTGLPITQGGWVTVYHERVTGRTTQIYISSHSDDPGQWVRKTDPTGSEWEAWEHFNPRQITQDVEDLKAQVGSTEPGENVAESIRDTLVQLGHAATPWETANLAATYDQGELYLDQVVTQVPFTRKDTIGHSTQGKPITALRVGVGGKPIVFIDCATHGDEISPREAMLIWAKMSASRRPEWMEHVTAYVVPTLNTDRINIRRYNGAGDDINRDYVAQATPEAQAIVAAVQAQQPIFYATCHEYRWDSNGDRGILMEPTNVAWLPDETVKTVSGRLYDEIGDHLVENGVDYGPYPQIFDEGESPVQAHYYMSSVLNIPSMLIEGPGLLESHHGLQDRVHPRRYYPDLGKRIHDYMLVFDQIMDSMATIVQEREDESEN